MASTNKIHMIIIFMFSVLLLIFTDNLSMAASIPEKPGCIQPRHVSCFPPPIRGSVPDFGRHRSPEPDPGASPAPAG
ncbi:hypothetical protein DsansV1_C35g0229411 [Dioscorea sansibarensis]